MPALVAEGGAGAGVAGPVFGLVVGEAGGGDAVVLVACLPRVVASAGLAAAGAHGVGVGVVPCPS